MTAVHRLRATAAVLLVGLLPAGCGGSGAASPADPVGTYLPMAGVTQPPSVDAAYDGPLTLAGARRMATAVDELSGILPDFTLREGARTSTSDVIGAPGYRCLGLALPNVLARDDGTRYVSGDVTFDFASAVLGGAGEAAALVEAWAGPGGSRCLGANLEGSLTAMGFRVAGLVPQAEPVGIQGADESVEYHATGTFTSGGRSKPVDVWWVLIRHGRTVVAVDTLTTGPRVPDLHVTVAALTTKAAASAAGYVLDTTPGHQPRPMY